MSNVKMLEDVIASNVASKEAAANPLESAQDEEEVKDQEHAVAGGATGGTQEDLTKPGDEGKHNELMVEPEDLKENESDVIYRIMDSEQTVPEDVRSRMRMGCELKEVDPEWGGNITMGSVEFRRIVHDEELVTKGAVSSAQEELWFAYRPTGNWGDELIRHPRKVFFAFKVNRVSSIDTSNSTFQMSFFIIFTWLMTVEDYKSYLSAKSRGQLEAWEPPWKPTLKFTNCVDGNVGEWEEFPEEGRFRVITFEDFGQDRRQTVPDGQFDCRKARFIQAKLNCDMTFAEEFELHSFPFDCQDLTCSLGVLSTTPIRLLPELRKPLLGSLDTNHPPPEWSLEGLTADITLRKVRGRRLRGPGIIIKVKLLRFWLPIIIQQLLVIFMSSLLSLIGLSIDLDEDGLSDRMGFTLTLLLTVVLFDSGAGDRTEYLTFMDKYTLITYAFLSAVMVENAVEYRVEEEYRYILHIVMIVLFVLYNGFFVIYAMTIREKEKKKITMGADEIKECLRGLQQEAKRMSLDVRRGVRTGEMKQNLKFAYYPDS